MDVTAAALNQAGTGTYIRRLREALDADGQPPVAALCASGARSAPGPRTVRSRLGVLHRDLLWTHVLVPRRARALGADVLHMPANVAPLLPSCATVVTIYDTTVVATPERFPLWPRTYHRFFMPRAARGADRVLTISEHSKRDIVAHLGVDPERVTVTPLAASPEFRVLPGGADAVRSRLGLGRFVLTVGSLEPRKNLVRLVQAFAHLVSEGFEGQLVHAGPPGWLSDDVPREVVALGLGERVRFLGHVPLAHLVELYNAASVLAYPSLYEGFGFPVLEAMACGCPVVTSNVASIPEVAGEAALLVDPLDVDALAAALSSVLADAARASALREMGLLRARLFSWERCAKQTRAAYREVAEDARRAGRAGGGALARPGAVA